MNKTKSAKDIIDSKYNPVNNNYELTDNVIFVID